MIDIRWVRDNPDLFDEKMRQRGGEAISHQILSLDARWRDLVQQVQERREQRNQMAQEIGRLKREGTCAEAATQEAHKLRQVLSSLEEEEAFCLQKRDDLLQSLPNPIADDVPPGTGEAENVEVHRWGTPRTFSFPVLSHEALGEGLGQMDFETAAKLSGARFVLLKGDLARLERALAHWMLEEHRKNGYLEVSPPYLVQSAAVFGVAQLPKFSEDLFGTTDGRWLISTAEVSLTNMVREATLLEAELPLRLTAYTPCFRSEAGAAGKDTKGMIRLHQFSKVELVSITTPEQSQAEHTRMRRVAESLLEKLEIPYRTVLLCAGDIGFASQKTYDIEVWLPSQERFREISSCSNCGDFQARRMAARFKGSGKRNEFVHTLNGSALAVGRTLVAVLENYQASDGSIEIPAVLRPYMNNQERIRRA